LLDFHTPWQGLVELVSQLGIVFEAEKARGRLSGLVKWMQNFSTRSYSSYSRVRSERHLSILAVIYKMNGLQRLCLLFGRCCSNCQFGIMVFPLKSLLDLQLANLRLDATYGAALQNLKFTDARKKGPILVSPSKWQKTLYGIFTVGGQYAWRRWEDWLVDNDNGYDEPSPAVRKLTRLSSSISSIHSTAALVSFLVFLVNGRYRTLLDRILRLRLAPPTSQVSREVSFEYLNRQLVWHAFTEFLLFVLPLVGISRWRRWLSRAWRKTKSIMQSGSADEEEAKSGELSFLPERTCAICYQDQNSTLTSEAEIVAASGASGGVIGSAQTDITNPYETIPCGCIYCFVCLAGRLEAEEGEGWICLRCGEIVKECKPWRGDVLEEASKHAISSKSVGFSDDSPEKDQKDMPVKPDHLAQHDERRFLSANTALPEKGASDVGSDQQSEGYEEDEAPEFDDY
jgi:peroxin-2